MIKLAMLASGHMRDQPIEDRAVLLILVQPEIQEVPQEAPALGDTKTIGITEVTGARVAFACVPYFRKAPKSRVASNPSPTTGAPVVYK